MYKRYRLNVNHETMVSSVPPHIAPGESIPLPTSPSKTISITKTLGQEIKPKSGLLNLHTSLEHPYGLAAGRASGIFIEPPPTGVPMRRQLPMPNYVQTPNMPVSASADSLRIYRPEHSSEEVVCCLCHSHTLIASTIPLQCSHFAHLRCLRIGITSGEMPLCEICHKPTHPTEAEHLAQLSRYLVPRHIPSGTVGTMEMGGYATPQITPEGTPEPVYLPDIAIVTKTPETEIGRNLPPSPKRRTSSVYSALPTDFSIISSVEANSVLTEWTGTDSPLEITVVPDPPTNSCLVRVFSPADAYTKHELRYHDTTTDTRIAIQQAHEAYGIAAFRGVQIDTVVTGPLRLCTPLRLSTRPRSDIKTDVNTWEWIPVDGYLFERGIVLCSYFATGEKQLHTTINLSEDDVDTKLYVNSNSGPLLKLTSHSLPSDIWLRSTGSGDPDTIIHWQSLLCDHTLRASLAAGAGLGLGHPLSTDWTPRPALRLVMCLPSELLSSTVTAVLGRLAPFDRLGLVIYDADRIIEPRRAIWTGWERVTQSTVESRLGPKGPIDLVEETALGNIIPLEAAVSLKPTSVIYFGDQRAKTSSQTLTMLDGLPIHSVACGSGAEALAQLAGFTGGGFAFVRSPEEAAEFAKGITAAEKSITHHNTHIHLQLDEGIIARVEGSTHQPNVRAYSTPPLAAVAENHKSQIPVSEIDLDLGTIRAGQSLEVLIFLESTTAKVSLSATASALSAMTHRHSEARASAVLELTPLPVRELQLRKGNGYVNLFQLTEFAASTLENCLEYASTHRECFSVSMAFRVDRKLQELSANIPSHQLWPNANFQAALAQARVLIRGLSQILCELDTDALHLYDDIRIGCMLEAIYILRSRVSFTRRHDIAAIFFEHLDINVI